MTSRRLLSPVLLVSVVVIATSGLVYELVAGTLASYVLGDSVAQFSFVIGLYLFAMGGGSFLSRHLTRRLLERFVEVELAIALFGGASAPLLFVTYTSGAAFRGTLYLLVVVIGMLVGLEIPLLIRLLEFRLSLKELVARVLSLDYVGALVASLLFPLVLLPRLGLHRTSLLFGLLNAAVALAATYLLPVRRESRWRLRAQCAVIGGALALGMVFIDPVVVHAEETYFGAPIVYQEQSPYQRIVITRSPRTTRLFLNGHLQFSSDDERRYHEVLVHPAVAALGREPRRVLVLGGGDGLAVRELLRYPGVEQVLLVDLDSAMTRIFRQVPVAVALNRGALSNDKVTVRNEDALHYLQHARESFDLAVVDFPDPSSYALGKLYTLSFYRLLRERVGVRGVAVVQATSPYYARRSFWTVGHTLAAAGFEVLPMHVYVPSFGEWGFLLAGGTGMRAPTRLLLDPGALSYLEPEHLGELLHFAPDMAELPAPINRLADQQLVAIYAREWGRWTR